MTIIEALNEAERSGYPISRISWDLQAKLYIDPATEILRPGKGDGKEPVPDAKWAPTVDDIQAKDWVVLGMPEDV